MKVTRSGAPPSSTPPGCDDVPTLPVGKAFVVQFSRETSQHTGTFSGRVEHMSSGRRARFTSAQNLLAVLQTMLAEVGETPTSL